jgi:MFS transporter, ACS family, D-galactonate transporter
MNLMEGAIDQRGVALRRTRTRYAMLALITVGTAINYLDRTNIAIVAPTMAKELGIGPALLGVVFSAFAWTYAAAQIPGGFLLDRLGTRITYFLSLTAWSVFTGLQGLTTSFVSLLPIRLGLGLSEAPAFPANNRVVTTWFPTRERAFATGVYVTGEYVGLAFLSPVLIWMVTAWGWRTVFFTCGSAGIVWAFLWLLWYRDPDKSPSMNQAERDYIIAGGAITRPAEGSQSLEWRHILRLLRYRQIWGICIGQFAISSTLYFFLTWFPTYLVQARHMNGIREGFFAMLPYIAATIGVLAGGAWSDALLRRGASINMARKLPIVIGLLLASCIVGANYVESQGAVIAILSLAFFAQGMSAISWTLVSDLAPEGLLGVTGGLFNLAGNLSGIVTPLVIGFLVSATGSFVGALVFVAAIAVAGALAYIFLVGDIRRIVIH